MARARNIKPGFFKNEILAELSFEQRLLFIGLWTLADREGRLEDRPKRIKAELFAFDSIDVDPMLDRLRVEGFLIRYEVGGVRYIHITNFVKHQDPHYKEKASEIPPPPGFENEVKATNVTRTQRQRILERDGFRCKECGSEDHLSIDHVVPVSRGGDSSDENLQVLCIRCNTGKSNKLDGEERARKRPKQGILPGSVFDVERRPDVEPKLNGHQINASAPVPLTPDSGFPLPDSLPSPNGEVSGPAPRAAPPTPPPDFDGRNAETLNGKAIVPIAVAWELPEQWGIDAESLGWKPTQVLRESEKFRQYWTAGRGKGTRRSVKGWRQAWSNWLEKAAKDQR